MKTKLDIKKEIKYHQDQIKIHKDGIEHHEDKLLSFLDGENLTCIDCNNKAVGCCFDALVDDDVRPCTRFEFGDEQQ